jgi:hypothetical protein
MMVAHQESHGRTRCCFVSQCSFLPFPFSFALSGILLTTAMPCDALSVVWPQKEKEQKIIENLSLK